MIDNGVENLYFLNPDVYQKKCMLNVQISEYSCDGNNTSNNLVFYALSTIAVISGLYQGDGKDMLAAMQ